MTQAVVYIRYSTPAQEKGDSKQRQIDDCGALCARKGWPIAETIQDLGQSAWKGHHLSIGELGRFAARVRSGDVPADTVLVVEKLDRLSRLEPRETLRWMEDLCSLGLKIATVSGDRLYDDVGLRTDIMNVMEILMKAKLAHDESQQKSERVLAAKVRAYERAKATGQVMTAKCPGWLVAKADRSGFEVIEERAQTIREIYEMSASGMGAPSIASRLNDRGIPAWGKWRRTHSTQTWEISAVALMLKQPSVEGDYIPGFSNTKSLATTKLTGRLVGYYPRIVDADLVARGRAGSNARKIGKGNRGGGVANLFAGVIRCAECHGPMHIRLNGDKNPQRNLQCYAAARHRGCSSKAQFRYGDFENAALTAILHLALDSRFFAHGDEVGRLRTELAEIVKALEIQAVQKKRLIRALAELDDDPDVAADIREINASALALQNRQGAVEIALTIAHGHASEAEHLARVGDIRAAMGAEDVELRMAARRKVQAAIRGTVQAVLCDSADDHRGTPERTFTMILIGGCHAIKFDNHGNIIGQDDTPARLMEGDPAYVRGVLGGSRFKEADLDAYLRRRNTLAA